jgi:hypothetical protein
MRAKAFPGEDRAKLADPADVAAFALPLLLPSFDENGALVHYHASNAAAPSLAASNDA